MKHLFPSLKMYLWMSVLLGLIYPAVVTLFGQALFPFQANGSFIERKGQVIGSKLIAQKFEGEQYFWSRPSAVDYNPLPSGGSNLGPTSAALKEGWVTRQAKMGPQAPQSLLFASASGLDPELDLEAVNYQILRIAKVRGVPESVIQSKVEALTERRQLGFLGEVRINVLQLNLALDEIR